MHAMASIAKTSTRPMDYNVDTKTGPVLRVHKVRIVVGNKGWHR
jgi:hypothetical protein